MGRKKKAEAEGANAVTTTETAPETEPTPEVATAEPKPKKGKGKKKAATGGQSLTDVAEGYLAQMEKAGKSEGTISSYKMELRVALDELGAETPAASLTQKRVAEFFDCTRVTKLRSGKPKAKPSIDKTRRVLRLALVWAEEQGFIEKAPIPEEPAEARA